MQSILTVPSATPALLALSDDDLASRSPARLLITAASSGEAETHARRIHRLSAHRDGPFVRAEASSFPVDYELLRQMCADLLEAAADGTLFINAVETMPATVQAVFIELLDELGPARDTSKAVRVLSGTSVSLLDCVAAGTFAEQLFYRLNIVHLIDPKSEEVVAA
jgi:DNA-binding NtrC family response regulator